MARKQWKGRDVQIRLIEYDQKQLVVDTPLGRIVVEPTSVRFHRRGRGRGTTLLSDRERP